MLESDHFKKEKINANPKHCTSRPTTEDAVINTTNQNEAFIYFRADRKMIKVFLKDILYVESLKDYIKVITDSKQIITKQSISSLEEMLPADQFIRIHRSYLVSINKIESFTADDIEIGKKELPIGRMFQHEVNRVLKSMNGY